MKQISYNEIVTQKLLAGCIDHNGHTGFLEDYRVLHCLLKSYKPIRFMEIGTCVGAGTNIIKNALGNKSEVFSLDLPKELSHLTGQHPTKSGDVIGERCPLPYTQLYGNSQTFEFSKYYPIHGWFIDAEHNFISVKQESIQAAKSGAKIIIFHDADEPEVYRGIEEGFRDQDDYELYRVTGTRIAYALKIK